MPERPPLGFRIKICGVRDGGILPAIRGAGADAVGLNFYPPSLRSLDPTSETTVRLAAAVREQDLLCIGVFVDEDPASIIATSRRLKLEGVQLHGNETTDQVARLRDAGLEVWRAIRLPGGPLEIEAIETAVAPWRTAGAKPLLDADAGSQFGGQGLQLDWTAVGKWSDAIASPFALAGGLTPQTVKLAIAEARPAAVDVASGVEEPRGKKDAIRIAAFCAAAEAGWATICGEYRSPETP